MFETKTIGKEDLARLDQINDKSIVKNLHDRFNGDKIYSSAKPSVVVSVNPFKLIKDMYSRETFLKYHGAGPYDNEVHLYTFVETMLVSILNDHVNQAIIFTGESGSGKTVNARNTLSYVQQASSLVNPSGTNSKFEQTIIDSQDVLEIFGNAKTNRNNNSSRFGKFMKVNLDERGQIKGIFIKPIMLEKSRVSYVPKGNRNFHIFYALTKVKNKYTSHLDMMPYTQYKYLADGVEKADNWDDEHQFDLAIKALENLSVPESRIKEIFELLKAILLMGNIDIQDDGLTACKVVNREVLEECASWMKIDPTLLENNMTFVELMAGDNKVKKTYNKVQSTTIRDSIAKKLYSDIFDWLIEHINRNLEGEGKFKLVLLDIFGFEIFEENSYEQFLINFCNEKLQQLLIENTMKREKQLYLKEGIHWKDVTFKDNSEVIELIENILLPLLTDACKKTHGIDEGSGQAYGQEIRPHQGKVMTCGGEFMNIHHYTTLVSYTIKEFVKKNREMIRENIREMLESTINEFMKEILALSDAKEQMHGKKTFASERIVEDCKYLTEEFAESQITYVRCIKSSPRLKPNDFDEKVVAKQVQDLGLAPSAVIFSETCAMHMPFKSFVQRYAIIADIQVNPNIDDRETLVKWCSDIMKKVVGDKTGQFEFGKTLIFIRNTETVDSLLDMKINKINQHVLNIQKELAKLELVANEKNENLELAQFLKEKERNEGLYEVPQINRRLISPETIGGLSAHLKRKEKILGTFLLKKFPRTFKETKCSFLQLAITDQALLMFRKAVIKGQSGVQTELLGRFTAQDIASIEVSKLKDRFCVIKFAEELKLQPMCIWVNFLPTMLWTLADKHGMNTKIKFADTFSYGLKPLKGFKGQIANKFGGLKMVLRFVKKDSRLGAPNEASVRTLKNSSKMTEIDIRGGISFAQHQPDQVKLKNN